MVFTLIYGLYSGQLTPDSEIRNKNKIDLSGKFKAAPAGSGTGRHVPEPARAQPAQPAQAPVAAHH